MATAPVSPSNQLRINADRLPGITLLSDYMSDDEEKEKEAITGTSVDRPAKRRRLSTEDKDDDAGKKQAMHELVAEIEAAVPEDDPGLRHMLVGYARYGKLDMSKWDKSSSEMPVLGSVLLYIDACLERQPEKKWLRFLGLSMAKFMAMAPASAPRDSSSYEPSSSAAAAAASSSGSSASSYDEDEEEDDEDESDDSDSDSIDDDGAYICLEYGHTRELVSGQRRFLEFIPVLAHDFLTDHVHGKKAGVLINLPATDGHTAKTVRFTRLATSEVDAPADRGLGWPTVDPADWLQMRGRGFEGPIQLTLRNDPDLTAAYLKYVATHAAATSGSSSHGSWEDEDEEDEEVMVVATSKTTDNKKTKKNKSRQHA